MTCPGHRASHWCVRIWSHSGRKAGALNCCDTLIWFIHSATSKYSFSIFFVPSFLTVTVSPDVKLILHYSERRGFRTIARTYTDKTVASIDACHDWNKMLTSVWWWGTLLSWDLKVEMVSAMWTCGHEKRHEKQHVLRPQEGLRRILLRKSKRPV